MGGGGRRKIWDTKKGVIIKTATKTSSNILIVWLKSGTRSYHQKFGCLLQLMHETFMKLGHLYIFYWYCSEAWIFHAPDPNGCHTFYETSQARNTKTIHVLLNGYIEINDYGNGIGLESGTGVRVLWWLLQKHGEAHGFNIFMEGNLAKDISLVKNKG